MAPVYVAVVGAGRAATADDLDAAYEIGRLLAERDAVVVCGGLGGVMEAAAHGASDTHGVSLGILPGDDRAAANEWVTFTIPTGLGEARNAIVARAADAMIAVGGELGTLSEIALALRNGTPVVGYRTWELATRDGPFDGIVAASSAADAVELALGLAVTRSG